jgi:hypothetical protein
LSSTPIPRVLVATTAVVALTGGAASAFATTPASPTSLTISTASTGTSTKPQTVTGTLKSGTKGLGGQVVRLVGRVAGSTSFKTLRYAKTTSTGAVTFTVTPPKGKDVYELVYNGSHKASPAYAGSHSKTVTVTVGK